MIGTSSCSATIQLFFRAENLPDKDVLSKSDPYLVLFNSVGGQRGNMIGRTEVKKDTLCPKFERTITMDYFFELKQELQIFLFDDDGKGPENDDKLGNVTILLSSVMCSRGCVLTVPLAGSSTNAKVIVTGVESASNGRDIVNMKLVGKSFAKMDLFGKADPYLLLRRVGPNGRGPVLYKSEVIDNTYDPCWKPIPPLCLEQLTGKNTSEKTIVFEFWDKDLFNDDFIGEVVCSLDELSQAAVGGNPLVLVRQGKRAGKTYGKLFHSEFRITKCPRFVDYISNGWQLNLAVCIDFTGSNGDPRLPTSLHYMDPSRPNQYIRALMSVGDILMEYDTDKMVPAFGFGAKLPSGQTSHFFHLNFEQNPYVGGVQGVLNAYGKALSTVSLSGPTNFGPAIVNVVSGARAAKGTYTILLILTDGEITDMDATIDAIVRADTAPLSIIIVGVGNGCDFRAMNILDGDIERLSSNGYVSKRDIVQFVPFRDFAAQPMAALAAEVLREVPLQFTQWAALANALPTQPQA